MNIIGKGYLSGFIIYTKYIINFCNNVSCFDIIAIGISNIKSNSTSTISYTLYDENVADSSDNMMDGMIFYIIEGIGRILMGVIIENECWLWANLTLVVVTALFLSFGSYFLFVFWIILVFIFLHVICLLNKSN